MREIRFRGKRIDNGEWGEGYYVYMKKSKSHRIYTGNCHIYTDKDTGRWTITPIFYKVIPETVGQFTGLTDKNGKKIFEGDIIKGKFCNYVIWFDETERAFVYGNSYKAGYRHHMSDYLLKSAFPHGIEVIGNIHDHPELLGGVD